MYNHIIEKHPCHSDSREPKTLTDTYDHIIIAPDGSRRAIVLGSLQQILSLDASYFTFPEELQTILPNSGKYEFCSNLTVDTSVPSFPVL